MHYIARVLARQAAAYERESEALLLGKQLQTLEAAARVVWQEESAELSKLTSSLKQVRARAEYTKSEC